MSQDNKSKQSPSDARIEALPKLEVLAPAKVATASTSAPAVTISVEEKPKTVAVPPVIEVSAVQEPERLVKVKPRKTEHSVRVGNDWYQFIKGKECLVPAGVRDWLEEKNFL